MTTEQIILKSLVDNEEYVRKTLPYIKDEYFTDVAEHAVFDAIKDYINKYDARPTVDELRTNLSSLTNITGEQAKQIESILVAIGHQSMSNNLQWLIDTTEEFCKSKALYIAMLQSMAIINGSDKKLNRTSIPEILQTALSVSFDPEVGHDYLEDFEKQFDYYHKVDSRVPFDIAILNDITNGGIPSKTLTVLMAGVHVGKSMTLCALAGGYLAQGHDVLYITLEMSKEETVKRIDANLMDVDMERIAHMSRDQYVNRANLLKAKTNGKLIVKEYPTTTANSHHFRLLLDELRMKKNFKPAVVLVDYLNLCASSRYKHGSAGMYEYVKAVAEELRGLAGIYDTRFITATQVNRAGYGSSDPDMTNTAESFGLPATADMMLALVTNEQLEALNQLIMIQLKNRFGDKKHKTRFAVGVDYQRQRIFDLDDPTLGINQMTIANSNTSMPTGNNKFRRINV